MDSPTFDARTVAAAVEGDRDALERALRAIEPELRASISIAPLWQRSLDADDVLQVSYLEAFLRIGSLREVTPDGFRAWMRRIVQNDVTDAVRELERDKRPDARRRVTSGPAGDSARTLFARLSHEDPSASAHAVLAEEVARLRGAIAKLPPSYARVVRGLDLEERSVEEVAEDLGRSRGAVHLLRSRAHVRLREVLSPGTP